MFYIGKVVKNGFHQGVRILQFLIVFECFLFHQIISDGWWRGDEGVGGTGGPASWPASQPATPVGALLGPIGIHIWMALVAPTRFCFPQHRFFGPRWRGGGWGTPAPAWTFQSALAAR